MALSTFVSTSEANSFTQRKLRKTIIDQRFNPGGNIDQELLQILQQKQYQKTRFRGSIEATIAPVISSCTANTSARSRS